MLKRDPAEFIERCLNELRTRHFEGCPYDLFDCTPVELKLLIAAFDDPANSEFRPWLAHCIWQNRQPETVGFLASLVNDPDDEVWKEALDGLVAIGGESARNALRIALTTISNAEEREWIEEAISQIPLQP